MSLKGSNRSNYFNVLPPGSADVAMHVGQDGGPYTVMLPTDGDYTVRVYLMRNAARRNEISNYELTVAVTGKPLAPIPASQDAVLPGTLVPRVRIDHVRPRRSATRSRSSARPSSSAGARTARPPSKSR